MAKRLLALALCLIMLASALVGCGKKDEDYKGAYINMYLTDMVYDLDPAHAYENESNLRVVSLLFDNLFVLDEDGKVKKSLAKNYEITENDQIQEYKMTIELNDTAWSDGIKVAANDVVYAWKRILELDRCSEAAALLYDIKNARAVREGNATIDDLGVYALNETKVEILFETKIDYAQFLLNLTSYALVPLREEAVEKTEDWAKKPRTLLTSGPFRIRDVSYEEEDPYMVLERNGYYYRDITKDKVDKSVKPYRLIINFGMTDEEIMQAYKDGKLFYVGDIPLSVRNTYKGEADVMNSLSTHTYVLNHNAVIRYYNAAGFRQLASTGMTSSYDPTLVEGVNGQKIFANAEVRKALSLAINRDAIAEMVVFAEAATAFVPNGVFNATNRKETFREMGEDIIATSANMDAAKAALQAAGIDPARYMFAISVAAYDDVHVAIAEKVAEAWGENGLGFHVAVNKLTAVVNDDSYAGLVYTDIKDDLMGEFYRSGNFEVAAIDYHAHSVDAFSALAKFAKQFSGQAMDMTTTDYKATPHVMGYDSQAFNDKMEAAFAEKNIEARANILHEAEKILLDEMAIIPIIYNKQATLTHKDLSKVKATYYIPATFTKTKLKNWEDFVPAE